MKKLVLALLFIVTITVQIQAQDNEAFQKEAVELIKLTGAGDAFVNAIEQIGAMVPEAKKMAYTEEAKGTLDGLYTKMAKLYTDEFTQDEIKQLLDFYRSDIGKKMASKQMVLAQKAMAFGASWGMDVQEIAKKYY
ncbi:MAG: DUF2059 domain-containing protein [Aestuariibaculum sp.]